MARSKVDDIPAANDRHHLAAEDDLDAAVRGNLAPGAETTRLRAMLSLSLSTMRMAEATELANDLASLNVPGLLSPEESAVVRERARRRLQLG